MTNRTIWEMINRGEPSASFFSNGSPPINQFARNYGRTFLGLTAGHDGTTDDGSPNPTGSWLQSFGSTGTVNPVTGWDYFEDLARVVATSNFGISGSFATRNDGLDSIGLVAAYLGDTATNKGWAAYIDSVKMHVDSGDAVSAEFQAANVPGPSPLGGMTPYISYVSGMVNNHIIGAGSDESVFGRTYAIDSFILISNNGAAAWTGINFRFDAIMRDGVADDTSNPGNTGYARAIAMAHDQGLSWYSRDPSGDPGTQVEAVRIYSTIDNTNTSFDMVFSDGSFDINETDNPGTSLFRVNYLGDAEARVEVTAATLGGSPLISVDGTNADINLNLRGKGNGLVGIGTYTGGSPGATTGYIEVVDNTGTPRRIPVV